MRARSRRRTGRNRLTGHRPAGWRRTSRVTLTPIGPRHVDDRSATWQRRSHRSTSQHRRTHRYRCAHGDGSVPPSKAPTLPEPVVASSLGPGDVFEVRVFQEPELSGVYRVGPQGDVIFPLCKRVPVAGLDANAAAEAIRACLAKGFMRDPQVSVLVKEYNSKKVFVFGEVQKPGTFTFQDGTSSSGPRCG